ncbi:universal stress protein [Glycomyces sp. YM15]|uniref:universal stress protein n=1 Tax=Glycomyces sp. YM15 TaxID=2800446 RepID=UPI001963E73A|nr:universal stress protein [Glycomyces sp. YM15]
MAEVRQERVVVGIDGSPTSMRALRWALRYAERTGARIEAVHAWQTPTSYGAPLAVLPGEDFAAKAEQAVNESVDRELGGRRDLEVERIADMGYAPKVLIEHSKKADLLVVGSRGRGGFTGTLLGSVSLHCVTNAACPVVVVRAKD